MFQWLFGGQYTWYSIRLLIILHKHLNSIHLKSQYSFEEFPKPSFQEWLDKAEADLKGKFSLDKFNWSPDQNMHLSPFYASSNLGTEIQASIVKTTDHDTNGWNNLAYLDAGHLEANTLCLEALNNGADGLVLNNLKASNANDALKGIHAEHCLLGINDHGTDPQGFKALHQWLEENSVHKSKIKGLYFLDQVDHDLLTGSSFQAHHQLFKVYEAYADYPQFKTLMVDASGFDSVGAGIVTQIGVSMAMLVHHIDHLLENGADIGDVARRIFFNISVGTSFFDEMAKIRALRYLSQSILSKYLGNGLSSRVHMHVQLSTMTKSNLDVDSNLLRSTSEVTSAILGGADSISVAAYSSNKSAQRISRNISNILKEESHLGIVQDPGAGAYFIEKLTNDYAKASWKYFQQIEADGGFQKVLMSKEIGNRVKAEREKRFDSLRTAKRSMIGVNNYGNTLESYDKHAWNSDVGVGKEAMRYAGPFERLRNVVEKHVSNNGESARPAVQPIMIGTDLAMRSARVNFTLNFFSWAGFHILPEKEEQEIGDDQNHQIVVFCGADVDYESIDIDRILNINYKRKLHVYFAGQSPNELIKKLVHKAIKTDVIHRKSDRLRIIEDILRHQEIMQ